MAYLKDGDDKFTQKFVGEKGLGDIDERLEIGLIPQQLLIFGEVTERGRNIRKGERNTHSSSNLSMSSQTMTIFRQKKMIKSKSSASTRLTKEAGL